MRCLEGLIDPCPKIPVGEEIPAQQGDQIGERPADLRAHLGVLGMRIAISAVQIWI